MRLVTQTSSLKFEKNGCTHVDGVRQVVVRRLHAYTHFSYTQMRKLCEKGSILNKALDAALKEVEQNFQLREGRLFLLRPKNRECTIVRLLGLQAHTLEYLLGVPTTSRYRNNTIRVELSRAGACPADHCESFASKTGKRERRTASDCSLDRQFLAERLHAIFLKKYCDSRHFGKGKRKQHFLPSR